MQVITRTYPAEFDYLTLYPISDVHLGSQECKEKDFRDYLLKIKNDDRAAVLLAGDLLNNGIKSSKTDVYKEKYSPDVQKDMMIDLLEPIKDKIIAGVSGNHELRTARETSQDVMKDIFAALQIRDRYSPDAAFVKISLGKKYNEKPATYMIYLTHGNGGGGLLGSGVSKQDGYQAIIEGVDISITGHTHKPTKTPSARIVFDPRNNKATNRNTLIFVCTAWLDYGGYPVRGQMKPAAFYPDTIRLDGKIKDWK